MEGSTRMATSQDARSDQIGTPYEEYSGYKVYDENQENIGKVDDLFVGADDQPEYMGVKMGFLGSSSTLIPMETVRVNEEQSMIQISADKERIKDGPAFDYDQEIDAAYEKRVREHYGLGESQDASERGSYGAYYSDSDYESTGTASGTAAGRDLGNSADHAGDVGPGMAMGDTESGEFVEHAEDNEGLAQQGSDLEDEDELRVQRSEEELRTGTHERGTGSVNVRKRVRTDRERITVPTRHEEVKVDRVPVSGEASEADIGEQDVSMPVIEEEVITEKKAMVKEEIRVRKEAVEDEEVIEEDLRKEEVEIDDQTERGSGTQGSEIDQGDRREG